MLILTRKKNESVVIYDNILIKVISTSDREVRLGFECPADIPIYREEIYLARTRDGIDHSDPNRNSD